MQINITSLLSAPAFVPFDLSNNRATLGDNAGKLTWDASKECATDEETPCLLNTEEKRDAFRAFVRGFGAWDDEEIAAWDDAELYALFLQWIAGDIREAFGDALPDEWDWEVYEENAEAGRVSSRLWRDKAGAVFFDLSN
jgi:hypothetical protein